MQPVIAVGICSAPEINFSLSGIYSAPSQSVVTGSQTARISESGLAIEWNGTTAQSIEFTPTSVLGDSFEIEGVTIGVKFHWERKENQRFRGSLRLIVEDGKITAVNLVDLEEYLKSVISSEMSATASLELLKAHAVISRSWLLAQIEGRHIESPEAVYRDSGMERIRWWDRSNHRNFDVCADDHCQRYQGITRVSSPNALAAVSATEGEVLVYGGAICDARFSKCCGGVLERFSTCWEDTDPPYLVPVRDNVAELPVPDLTTEQGAREWIMSSPEAFCNTDSPRILSQVLNDYDRETADFYRWSVSYTVDEISRLVNSRLETDLGDITDLRPMERGASGRISRLRICGTKGEIIIGKELMIRRALSPTHLYSSAFVVDRTDDGFTITGAGWGHGVGLCQIGAAVMGDRGYSYRSILAHYYKNATVEKYY